MAAPLVTFTPLHLEREGSNHPLNNRFPTCTRSLHQPSETYTLPGSLFSRKSLSAFTTWKKLLTTYFTSHHAITELNCVNVFFSFLNYYCLLSVFYRLHLIIKRKYLKLHIHFVNRKIFLQICYKFPSSSISQIFDLSSTITNLFSDFQFLITPYTTYNYFQDRNNFLIPHLSSSISWQNFSSFSYQHKRRIHVANERSSADCSVKSSPILSPICTHRNKRTRDTRVSLACLQPERCN